jgi:hypothetical protein
LMVFALAGDSTITTFIQEVLQRPTTRSRLPSAVRPRDMERPRLTVK